MLMPVSGAELPKLATEGSGLMPPMASKSPDSCKQHEVYLAAQPKCIAMALCDQGTEQRRAKSALRNAVCTQDAGINSWQSCLEAN